MAEPIVTHRLDLVPLAPSVLRLVAAGDIAGVERRLNVRVAAGWEAGVPAQLRLDQLAADPSEQPWLVRAVVVRADRRIVGSVGFHGPPDDRARVEIGYDIVTTERRKGYAREAVRGLIAWAWSTARARMCVASVGPHNAPSLTLVRSLGFDQVGQRIDDVDGLELVFERSLPLDP